MVVPPSIPPSLMPYRQAVKLVAAEAPLRLEPVHQRREPVVVRGLQQMRQLVNDDVLQTLRRLLGQFQVDQDGLGQGVA